MPNDFFQFKQFRIRQDRCALKVGTDGVLLGAWTDWSGAGRILDIGTGTGLLALIAAQRTSPSLHDGGRSSTTRIDAVEIDDAAAEQAAENVAASPWADRIRVHRMDVRRLRASEPYDVVVCNPPFYAGEMDSPDARKGLAKHGGELSFAELLDTVARLLAEEGRFSLIIPMDRKRDLLQEAERVGLHASRHCPVRYLASKPPKRVLLELRRTNNTPIEEDGITVEEKGPFDYSAKYRALLSDLMLKF
ncbi:MAG: methyltransferase [Flavobacteriales bacterium]